MVGKIHNPAISIISFDTETTGLDPCHDELLSVSVLDNDNRVLFHSYIKPRHRRKWRDAQKIHGITPEMVKHAPTYTMVKKYGIIFEPSVNSR